MGEPDLTPRGQHPGRCPLCTRPRTRADGAGLAWSSQHAPDGAITWICPTCTREQLWAIEALLPLTVPAPGRRAA